MRLQIKLRLVPTHYIRIPKRVRRGAVVVAESDTISIAFVRITIGIRARARTWLEGAVAIQTYLRGNEMRGTSAVIVVLILYTLV